MLFRSGENGFAVNAVGLDVGRTTLEVEAGNVVAALITQVEVSGRARKAAASPASIVLNVDVRTSHSRCSQGDTSDGSRCGFDHGIK